MILGTLIVICNTILLKPQIKFEKFTQIGFDSALSQSKRKPK